VSVRKDLPFSHHMFHQRVKREIWRTAPVMERHGRKVCAQLYIGHFAQSLTPSLVSHSSLTAQSRSINPTLPAAEAHGDNLRDSSLPSHSLPVHQDQGGPAAKREPSSSMSTSREMSQMPTDSHTRKKIPLDRIEHSPPSSSSPSSQPHTHTDSTTYSDIPTSRTEPSHSEPTSQEGAEGGRQIGDGGQQRGGISRNKTEAIRPPPTTSPSLPDQPFNTALAGPSATSLPPRLLDSPSKKSRDMLTSSSDRIPRTEGMCVSHNCRFSLSLTR
jgi:hypothetical protein